MIRLVMRRATLVLTVLAIIVCFGPLRMPLLVAGILRWIEDEFCVDLHKARKAK